MKKFNFSLESVLDYKQQLLDTQKAEHAEILKQLREQEAFLQSLENRYYEYNREYCDKKATGMSITEAILCQDCLRAMEKEIQQQTGVLKRIQKQEEQKREEVLEARKDTRSLETLREKKLDIYQKAVRKEEEKYLDDLIGMKRSSVTMFG